MGKGKETTSSNVSGPGVEYYSDIIRPAAENVVNAPFEAYGGQFTPGLSQYSTGAADLYGKAAESGSYTPADWNALTQQNMSAYTQNVMDPTLALMDRERQKQLVGEQGNIIGSGAFDSSRRGVFEAESSAAYGLGRDKMMADLMRQGYNEAQAATMAQQAAQQGALASGAAGMAGIGGMEQGLNAADLAGQYGEFMRQQEDPYARLAALTGAASAAPVNTTQTTTKKRGLFDYLTAAAQVASAIPSSDMRLKTNIAAVGQRDGIKFYTWDWNEDGKRIADPAQPKFGVMAQELQDTHPHLVVRAEDGFLRVNYDGLAAEMGAA